MIILNLGYYYLGTWHSESMTEKGDNIPIF